MAIPNTNSLFIGWNRTITGREKLAGELFMSSVGYYTGLKEKGLIDDWSVSILSNHGGDMNGFFQLFGSNEQLHNVRNDDGFMKIVMQGSLALENFGVIDTYHGDAVSGLMQEWTKLAQTI